MSSSNPYDSTQLDDFTKKRRRLLKSTGGIEDNNRRVRLLNFERAMKKQFGPNVVVDPSGTASRNGKVVGNLDDFLKAGGKLEGTPRDTRTKLAIEKQKQEEFDKNFDFSKAVDSLKEKPKTPEVTIKDFQPEETGGVNLDEIMKYSSPAGTGDPLQDTLKILQGTDSASAAAGSSTLQDQLNETNSRMARLQILQGASEADVAGMIKAKPSRIQQGLLESGFTPERLAKLKIKTAKFKLRKRGK